MAEQAPNSEQRYIPKQTAQHFGIGKVTYYSRCKFLGIQHLKDADNKSYLLKDQFEQLQLLHDWIAMHGKMEGFQQGSGNSLVKAEPKAVTAVKPESVEASEIYVVPDDPQQQFDTDGLVRSAQELRAREIAMPHLVKRAIADQLQEDELPDDLQEKIHLSREAANPKYTPRQVATAILHRRGTTKNS